jgi:hypothetical protein
MMRLTLPCRLDHLTRAGRWRRGASTSEQERRRITQGITAGVWACSRCSCFRFWSGRAPASLHAAFPLPILGRRKKSSRTPQNQTHALVLFIIMCNRKFRKSPISTWGNPQESRQLELISASGRCSIVSLRVVVRRSSGLMFTIVSVSLVACLLTELNDQSARAKMRTSLRPPASSARS